MNKMTDYVDVAKLNFIRKYNEEPMLVSCIDDRIKILSPNYKKYYVLNFMDEVVEYVLNRIEK